MFNNEINNYSLNCNGNYNDQIVTQVLFKII